VKSRACPTTLCWAFSKTTRAYLWITTNNASPNSIAHGTVHHLPPQRWPASNEFNSNVISAAGRNDVRRRRDGFNRFEPQKVKPNPVPPSVAITRLRCSINRRMSICPGRRPFSCPISRTSFRSSSPRSISKQAAEDHYASNWKVSNQDWIRRAHVRMPATPICRAGSMSFGVKGSNGDGVWMRRASSLRSRLRPPCGKCGGSARWASCCDGGLAAGVLLAPRQHPPSKSGTEQQVELRTAELQHEIEQRQKARKP